MHVTLPFSTLASSLRHFRAGFERIPSNLTRTELFRSFTFSGVASAQMCAMLLTTPAAPARVSGRFLGRERSPGCCHPGLR